MVNTDLHTSSEKAKHKNLNNPLDISKTEIPSDVLVIRPSLTVHSCVAVGRKAAALS